MKIWIMNLKDNRNNGENKNSDKKFSICKEHEILAIGWANEDINNSTDAAYINAYNRLSDMKRNDLVWVKNPKTRDYYICEISDDKIITTSEFLRENDIASAKKCKYHLVEKAVIDTEFKKGDLTAIPTIQGVSDVEIINKTKNIFKEIQRNENLSKM